MTNKLNAAKLTAPLFILLSGFYAQYASAIDFSPSASRDCVYIKACYETADNNLNRVYRQILESLSGEEKTALRNKQRAWLQERDNQCAQYEDNETKLTACRLDATIPRVAELSVLDLQVNQHKHQFEGKWESCFEFDDKELIEQYGRENCVAYYLIENDKNICGEWEDWASGRLYGGNVLLRAIDSRYAEFVKICSNGGYSGYANCYTNGDKPVAFSDWTTRKDTDDFHTQSAELSKGVKRTPFSPKEKETLIKENKWLQDCLNYQGQ
ncbi:MAG: DUF1311 domain-containing protein [Zoogloeaceae bacterium]|jgi:uncharacterized protein YecT (DUF1311 family)|nr:DUF1311 domain-containing protein [Zoogloeaceae bacterium]